MLLALLCAGCAAADPPTAAVSPAATAQPTRPPVPTATPAPSAATPEPVTWSNICSQPGARAELQGVLRLPDQLSCTVGNSPDSCTVQLYDPFTAQTLKVNLYKSAASTLPPGQMADLPETYTYADFKVSTAAGGLVGQGALVSLEGQVVRIKGAAAGELGCALGDVRQVTALQQLTPPAGDTVKQFTLADAIANGAVAAAIQGNGLEKIEVSLKAQVDYSVEIFIAPGDLFEALTGGVQSMVVRQAAVAVVRPQTEVSLELEVSCASMQKKEPHSSDSFKVAASPAAVDVQKLLALPDFAFAARRVQQFAVWTITDNPARDAYVGISSAGGSGTGPGAAEMDAIKALFVQAGIDPAGYNAFR